MIQVDAARPLVSVSSLTPAAGFTLSDGLVLPSPVIFLDGVTFMWDVNSPAEGGVDHAWEGWTQEKLKIFEVCEPRPGQQLACGNRTPHRQAS